ncbi:hypothetical protein HOLleu_44567 [Holothuria leucospilota]|uniref:Immunoglobulin domain-containing protein n=1 Tax=Holothuria leucospilota TaxID=206669 RepID=A0A9Q1BAT6_HOLLE|nr:hypothetical protein HOLleu_44567 [Holothuria leucospilota]
MKLFQLTAVQVFIYIINIRGFESNYCRSPQYIRTDSEEIIKCSFKDDVFSVLWYNSKDFYRVDAIVTLKDSVKSGEGFSSGEFDIFPNGSLIISNVSLKHEGTYTVIKLDTPTSRPVTYIINVFVIARTFERIPIIEGCDNGHVICFQTVGTTSKVSCTVTDARPAIPLSWMVRTTNGDRNMSSRSVITNETNVYFTSRTTILDPFAYSEILTLLACKADGPLGLLERNESLVLLQNSNETLINIKPKQIAVEIDSKVQLHCNYSKVSYLVWQVKQPSEAVFKAILYIVFVEENFTHINDKDYKLQQASLVIEKIRVQDEGTYRCVSGNGLEDNVIVYSVILFGK